jgi:hypothetical protein
MTHANAAPATAAITWFFTFQVLLEKPERPPLGRGIGSLIDPAV